MHLSNPAKHLRTAALAACLLASQQYWHGCASNEVGDATAAQDELGVLPADAFSEVIIPTDSEDHTGWTAGASGVLHDGSSTFSVPIHVPDGRRGLQPALSLQYNSRAGDGIIGTGWSLAGTSVITRCARTQRLDGAAHGVDLSDEDAFCLDGDRLVEEGQGFWGGGRYRRWRDGFERIDAEGALGDPELTWRVERPDGTIWIYGGASARVHGQRVTPDATGTLMPGADATYAWLVSRVEDRHGNFIEFEYDRSVHADYSVETHPSRIVYTGHATLGAGRRIVTFEYEPRAVESARLVQWIAGLGVRTASRLSEVRIWAPTTTVGSPTSELFREYRLTYQLGHTTRAQRLASVTECDAHGTCRAPLYFDYTGSEINEVVDGDLAPEEDLRAYGEDDVRAIEYGDVVQSVGCGHRAGPPSWRPGQSRFDATPTLLSGCGDPAGDWSPPPEWTWAVVREQDGPGTHAAEWSAATARSFVREWTELSSTYEVPWDYDRDGRAEYVGVAFDDSTGRTRVQVRRLADSPNPVSDPATETTWSAVDVGHHPLCPAGAAAVGFALGDLDGNGVAEILRGCDDEWDVLINQDNYGTYANPTPIPLGLDANESPSFVEWDGDGRADAMVGLPGNSHYWIHQLDAVSGHSMQSTNLQFEAPPAADAGTRHVFLDANGDGLTDVLLVHREDGALPELRLNVGGDLGPARPAVDPTDIDHWVWDQFMSHQWVRQSLVDSRDVIVADLNADGRDDFLIVMDFQPHPDLGATGCSPSGDRCLRMARRVRSCPADLEVEPFILAHFSDGERFHTMRWGPSGEMVNDVHSPTGRAWRVQATDLGADGLPDVVYDRWRQECCPGENGPTCDFDPSGDDILGKSLSLHVRPNRLRQVPDLLEAVRVGDATGESRIAGFEYTVAATRATDPASAYPLRNVTEGIRVVHRHTDEIGTEYQHEFLDPVSDLMGDGFLGFGEHFVEELLSGRVVETRFDHRASSGDVRWGFPFAGRPRDEFSYTADAPNDRLEHTHYEYQITELSDRHHAVQTTAVESRSYEAPMTTFVGGCEIVGPYDGCVSGSSGTTFSSCRSCTSFAIPSGSPLYESTTSVQYDEHGTPTQAVETTEDGFTMFQVTPEHRPSDWLIGLPQRVVERSHADVGGTTEALVRTTQNRFDSTGYLDQRTIEPDAPQSVVITYVPDAFGNTTSVTVTPDGLAPRTTRTGFDPLEAVHPRWFENELEQVTTVAVQPAYGVNVLTIDPNGVESRARYDSLGRPREQWTVGIEAARIQHTYERVDDYLRAHAFQPGHGRTTTDVDHLGRTHREREQAPDGWLERVTEYGLLGRMSDVYGPRPEGATTGMHRSFGYDNSDRLRSVVFHDGNPGISISYSGRTATVVDRRGNTTAHANDSQGRPLWRLVGDGTVTTTVTRDYGPFGSVRHVSHSAGPRWEWERDAYGRVTRTIDPDAGERSLEYDVLGQLLHERDGDGALLTDITKRDLLGRIQTQWTLEDGATAYAWDSATSGVGRLASASTDLGPSRVFSYDSFGRVTRRSLVLPGETLEVQQTYDSFGRLSDLVYPPSPVLGELRVRHHYTDPETGGGRLSRVVEVAGDAESPTPFWQATAWDVFGPAETVVLGNGFTQQLTIEPQTGQITHIDISRGAVGAVSQTVGYDENGNVNYRADQHPTPRTETFQYDSQNRLEQWAPSFEASPTVFDYDSLGNLTQLGSITQTYGEDGHGPHQLTSTSTGASFTYDALGRRLSGPTASIHSWTRSDLPRTATGVGGALHTFAYDALGSRAQATDPNGTRTYLDELYEREESDSFVKHTYRIYADGQSIAEIEEVDGVRSTHYLHPNHQGSIAAVSDESGNIEQYLHHEPFGERQAYLPGAAGGTTGAWSRRGFTGHEHDVGLGLINMRGRMYDPTTGRFLSTDPIIRNGFLPNALNPYAYVENNPLSLTDPTGFCPGCPDDDTGDDPPDALEQLLQLATAGVASLLGGSDSGHSSSSSGSGGVGGRSRSGGSGSTSRARQYAAPRHTAPGRFITPDFSAAGTTRQSALGGTAQGPQIGFSHVDPGGGSPVAARARRELRDRAYASGEMRARHGSPLDFVAGLGNVAFQVMFFGNEAADGRDLVAVLEDGGADTGVDRYSIEYGLFTHGPNLQDAALAGLGGLASAERGAASTLGGSARNVNPVGRLGSAGRTMNCANCVVATDATLAGRPATALPGDVTSAADVARAFGRSPRNWIPTTGRSGIETIMQSWGSGSRGVVFGSRAGGQPGHFFNVINQRGVVRFIDGQTGRGASLGGFNGFHLLRTN